MLTKFLPAQTLFFFLSERKKRAMGEEIVGNDIIFLHKTDSLPCFFCWSLEADYQRIFDWELLSHLRVLCWSKNKFRREIFEKSPASLNDVSNSISRNLSNKYLRSHLLKVLYTQPRMKYLSKRKRKNSPQLTTRSNFFNRQQKSKARENIKDIHRVKTKLINK